MFDKKETAEYSGNCNTATLLRRAIIFLEDGDWDSANEYCERVLDMDPENAQAYLCKLMSEFQVHRQEDLQSCADPFDTSKNYQKLLRFADDDMKSMLARCIEQINIRNENARKDEVYKKAQSAMLSGTEYDYNNAARLFASIDDYMDSPTLAEKCLRKADDAKKDAILAKAKNKMTGDFISDYELAIHLLKSISGWKDADETIDICKNKIEQINAEAIIKARKKRRKKIIRALIIFLIITSIILLTQVIIPSIRYDKAMKLYNAGMYSEAAKVFENANYVGK